MGSSKAVDGNLHGNIISHTNKELQPWWSVTFNEPSIVHYVEIKNRDKGIYFSGRLRDFFLFVTEDTYYPSLSNNKKTCASFPYQATQAQLLRLYCEMPIYGNHLILQIMQADNTSLHILELQAYAQTGCDSPTHSIFCSSSHVKQLSCTTGVLSILHAWWGRSRNDAQGCTSGSWDNSNSCIDYSAFEKLYDLCEGKKQCSFVANRALFRDPCYYIHKYINITYTCCPQWHTVFRAAADSDDDIYTELKNSSFVPDISSTVGADYISTDNTIKHLYKSALVECAWEHISQIYMTYYLNRDQIAFFAFQLNPGETKLTWFSQNNLIGSSYQDLPYGSYFHGNAFTMSGNLSRKFYVNEEYGTGCDVKGWSLVSVTQNSCPFENTASRPVIMVSPLARSSLAADYIHADVFHIKVLMKDTVPADCVSSCAYKQDGSYSSCIGCNVYVKCKNKLLKYLSCQGSLVFDGASKSCQTQSNTCTGTTASGICKPYAVNECNVPSPVANGNWSSECQPSKIAIGQKCSIECDHGYHLADNAMNIFVCDDFLTFNYTAGSIECKIDVCPKIVQTNHGVWSANCVSDDPVFGSVCIMLCDQGYHVTPNITFSALHCTAGGVFNDTVIPVCQVDICHKLLPDHHGTWTSHCVSHHPVYMDSCTLTCDIGYHVTPNAHQDSIQCVAGGIFNKPVFKCLINTCPRITQDGHGTWSESCVSHDPVYNGVCTLSCDQGYLVDTETKYSMQCEAGGTFNETIKTCMIADCGFAPVVNNGGLVSDPGVYIYQTQLTYSCDTGFEHTGGDTVRGCRADMTWSGTNIICTEIICPAPTSPPFTRLIRDPGSYGYQSVIEYRCETGYELVHGDLQFECGINRLWQGTTPQCEVMNCSVLPVVPNTHLQLSGISYSSTAEYSCHSGYRHASGDLVRHCLLDKQWNGTNPICLEMSCSDPPSTNHTQYTVEGLSVGHIVSYSCNSGSKPIRGNSQLVCGQSEEWEGIPLQCQEILCGQPPSIANAYFEPPSGYTVNSKTVYHCTEGYTPLNTGSTLSICLEAGNWSTVIIQCEVVDCGEPLEVQHTDYTFTGTSVNHTVTYRCQLGYQYTAGKTTAKCLSSAQWSQVDILCQVIRCPVQDYSSFNSEIANQTGLAYRDTISLSCRYGYEYSRGDTQRECTEGRSWSGDPLVCEEIRCPTPDHVDNSKVSYEPLAVDSTVTYTCKHGYYLEQGNLSRRCQLNGVWSGATPFCQIITCPLLIVPESSAIVISESQGNTFEDSVQFSCLEGYTMSDNNSSQITCLQSAQWNGSVPTCTIIFCEAPPLIENTAVNHSSLFHGSEATYSCVTGYVAVEGSSMLKCDSGTWQGSRLLCEAIKCPIPEVFPHTEMSFESLTFGSVVHYHCVSGYSVVSGNQSHTCTTDGQWQGTNLQCEKKICPAPLNVYNTRWSYDKNSIVPSVTYTCLPGFVLKNGSLTAKCEFGDSWSLDTPLCVASEDGLAIEVPEDPEPVTPQERVMAQLGMTKVDKEVTNYSIGIGGICWIVSTAVVIVALDVKVIVKHLRMMKRNLSSIRMNAVSTTDISKQ